MEEKLISYCTTCCNRLWQLALTLPDNLKSLKENEELILVNYGSTDNLNRYIQSSKLCLEFIENKKLIYAEVLDVKTYHCSKAKNIAHRLGNGNFLVNLDADNFNFEINDKIQKYKDKKCLIYFGNGGDTCGRIAIEKNGFYGIGGYDESFMPMGFQDIDLILRACELGFGLEFFKEQINSINLKNSKAEKMINTGLVSWEECNRTNTLISEENRRNKQFVVNKNGWGNANLIKFKRKYRIKTNYHKL
jgi:hypothetical protein